MGRGRPNVSAGASLASAEAYTGLGSETTFRRHRRRRCLAVGPPAAQREFPAPERPVGPVAGGVSTARWAPLGTGVCGR